MNFVIITQSDPVYAREFFLHFLKMYPKSSHHLKGVMIQRTLNNKNSLGFFLKLLRTFGLIYTTFLSLNYFMEKADTIIPFSGHPSTKRLLKRFGIPILDCSSVNSTEFHEFISKNEIHLVVSLAASELFKKEILARPRFGCINFHNGPLPRYRGIMPNFWQMVHGEQFSVLTVHKMVSKLDAGEIILQEKTPIREGMTLHELALEGKRKSALSLFKVLDDLESEVVRPISNDISQGSYYSFPTRRDVLALRKQGKKLYVPFHSSFV